MIPIEEKKNPIFEGNIYWIYEAFKLNKQDFDFDKPYTDKQSLIKDKFLIYECLMFNEDRENSLFIMQDGILYEYFSASRSELILKLIQYYENRLKWNLSNKLKEDSEPIEKIGPLTHIINKRFKYNKKVHEDPELKFKSIIKANIFIEYKDRTSKWIYNYELKKLLFYFQFIPRQKEISIMRIFPLSVKELETKTFKFIDFEDQLMDSQEAQIQKALDENNEREMVNLFAKEIKKVFYDKYLLNLKKMDVIAFKLDEKWYILNITNFIFEKYENKHVKLDTEGLFYRYIEKYKDLMNNERDNRKLSDIEKFYKTMVNKYDCMFHNIVSNTYLDKPPKDPTSDNVYKMIKPDSPYTLSDLMEPRTDLKTFVKWATYNLWNEDNKGS